ncbi:MAG TPA: hypothetical protein VMD29_12355, partial [Terracidiphilus sp.]|nr:hypothetical protein [Terracidiphilus sp.]
MKLHFHEAPPQQRTFLPKLIGRCFLIAMLQAAWLPALVEAQTAEPAAAGQSVVPLSIRFSGTAQNRAGDTVEAEFRIYATQEGGDPLWSETQRVSIREDGNYSALLGT